MNNQDWADITFNAQRYFYVCVIIYLIIEMVLFQQIQLTTIQTANLPSMIIILLFGLYIIKQPYYQVSSGKQLIFKFIESLAITGFALGLTEGSWDIPYLIHWPKLLYEIDQSIGISYGIIIFNAIIGSLKHFNKKILLGGLVSLTIYYILWLSIGFPTSGEPLHDTTLLTHLIEIGHWAIGITTVFLAWKFRKQ